MNKIQKDKKNKELLINKPKLSQLNNNSYSFRYINKYLTQEINKVTVASKFNQYDKRADCGVSFSDISQIKINKESEINNKNGDKSSDTEELLDFLINKQEITNKKEKTKKTNILNYFPSNENQEIYEIADDGNYIMKAGNNEPPQQNLVATYMYKNILWGLIEQREGRQFDYFWINPEGKSNNCKNLNEIEEKYTNLSVQHQILKNEYNSILGKYKELLKISQDYENKIILQNNQFKELNDYINLLKSENDELKKKKEEKEISNSDINNLIASLQHENIILTQKNILLQKEKDEFFAKRIHTPSTRSKSNNRTSHNPLFTTYESPLLKIKGGNDSNILTLTINDKKVKKNHYINKKT